MIGKKMRLKKTFYILFGLILLVSLAAATEMRIYRQSKDIVTQENGKVIQSKKPGDLFEFAYQIDFKKNLITRVKVRRLDDPQPHDDATIYTIIQKKRLWGSPAGNGGRALVAINKENGDILELSHGFAFTMRTSPFSQVITGVYKRIQVPRHCPASRSTLIFSK
jgi:hypothetical protein